MDDVIVSGARSVGTILTKTRDRTSDEPWIDFAKGSVVEAVFGQPTEFEILDHHIGFGGETADNFLPIVGAKIDNDRTFTPVGRVEISGIKVFTLRSLNPRRPPFSGIVAVRALDFDNIGPQIAERLTDPRTR